jgi:hypothetical protein
MKQLRRLTTLLAIAAAVAALSARAVADEGFWPFNAIPKSAIKAAFGFEPSDAWLQHLQQSAIRFGGASGSFISPDGLILTNHHVGLRAIQRLSTPEKDFVKNGFYAATAPEELKAPDMELSVLQGIEDVTAQVNAAVKAGTTSAEGFAARRGAVAAIEKASQEKTGLRSEVVTLYQGALYHLYRYKTYTDIRLVFAPEFDTAFFGGDPDNFTYPRYCLDICLFRAYENDKPVKVEHYLSWSLNGAKDGDPIFVAGHPGATQRLNTLAHLEYLRDHGLPWSIGILERRQAALKRYGGKGAEETRQAKDELFGIENSLKSQRGQIGGLKDAGMMAKKAASDDRLRKALASDAAKQRQYGGAWDVVAKARRAFAAYYKEHSLLEGAAAFNSRYFSIARNIVRLTAERPKPEADRLPEYGEARLASLERQLYSPAPIFPALEKAKLVDTLTLLAAELGAANPVVAKVFGGKTPEARAAELVDGTTLGAVDARKALVAGGAQAVAASADPMIALARAIDAESRAVRKRYEDEVASVERDAYAQIAQAVFAVQGTSAYPDATSTLRLSYGAVKGYQENGKAIRPFTDFAGLYAHSAAHNNVPPYQLPDRWVAKKGALKLDTPFDFVATLDIVGGNSGSPVVNRDAEIVGLIFDGNIQMLPGYYIYDAGVNRAVSVDSRAILEALKSVYGAERLVTEIAGARGKGTAR